MNKMKLGYLVVLLFIIGCNGDGTVSLRGKVTFNGENVQNGSINLEPIDGKGSTNGATIIDGTYEIKKVKPGEKLVRINASYVVGQVRANDNPEDKTMIDIYESLIPKEFNLESKEKFTVTNTNMTKDYALTGEDPRKKPPASK